MTHHEVDFTIDPCQVNVEAILRLAGDLQIQKATMLKDFILTCNKEET
jgi:hypothetical protein